MASVDVVVPCYNYARYLPACVQSILSQPGVDVRVTIIDDQSSDNTAEVASELARNDTRVRFIRHEVNKGHIATYNEGLALATHDYVVLLSADDLLTPGALRRATDLMDANPGVGFTYGVPISFHTDVPPPARTQVSGWSVWKGTDWIRLMCKSGRNFITCPEVVMRTRIQHEIGGYRASLPHTGDMEMWLRAAASSDVGRVNGTDQAYYRVHSASMQRTIHKGFLLDMKGRLDAIESAFATTTAALTDTEAMVASAKKAIAKLTLERVRRASEAGETLAEPFEDYRHFALSIHPDAAHARSWRRLERARQGRTSAARRALYWMRAKTTQRVQDHLVWRRWWKTGVF
jgi:hypothetical protein